MGVSLIAFYVVRHVGDLGNVQADGRGKVIMTFLDRMVSLEGTNNVIGRSVVVSLLIIHTFTR